VNSACRSSYRLDNDLVESPRLGSKTREPPAV
jgi:hypothetical protein